MIHVGPHSLCLVRPELDNTCAYVLLRRHVRGELCCTSDRTWPRTLCEHCKPCMYKCRCPGRTPPCAELIEVFETFERRSMRKAWPVDRKHFDRLQRSVGRIWDRPNRPLLTVGRTLVLEDDDDHVINCEGRWDSANSTTTQRSATFDNGNMSMQASSDDNTQPPSTDRHDAKLLTGARFVATSSQLLLDKVRSCLCCSSLLLWP